MILVKSITAGTLLMAFERTAVVALRPVSVVIPSGRQPAEDAPVEPRPFARTDDDEEADEQHEQIPVDRRVDLARPDAPRDEERRSARGRDERRVVAGEEPAERPAR